MVPLTDRHINVKAYNLQTPLMNSLYDPTVTKPQSIVITDRTYNTVNNSDKHILN